ncbi:MAG: hypothetical protein H6Q90_308 [Deltaproteobacteria bacterium]|nr:hypothetical protein [Deltaproteobacteria bacterium]
MGKVSNTTSDNTGTGTHRIESIKEGFKGLVDQGQDKAKAIKERVVDVKDQAMSRGSHYMERATDMIKAHPLKAVGIAFGAGYLGTRLFRR